MFPPEPVAGFSGEAKGPDVGKAGIPAGAWVETGVACGTTTAGFAATGVAIGAIEDAVAVTGVASTGVAATGIGVLGCGFGADFVFGFGLARGGEAGSWSGSVGPRCRTSPTSSKSPADISDLGLSSRCEVNGTLFFSPHFGQRAFLPM